MKRVLIRYLVFGSVFLLGLGLPFLQIYAEDRDFFDWLQTIREEAIRAGVEKLVLDEALENIAYRPRIIELDRSQPEGRQSFEEYLQKVISTNRILGAQQRLSNQEELLNEIAQNYHVQNRFVVALWGLESDFGRFTGGFPVIDALATLAFDGRRGEFFLSELIQALLILDNGDIDFLNMNGSWAGAMGQCQFMPSSYQRYAIDYNQDGRRDIWSTKEDIFASIANYLHVLGWKDDQTWGREVILPLNFDFDSTGLETIKPINVWQEIGIRRIDGRNLPARSLDASIILPDGINGRAFMVYNNFRTLLKWNRSIYFALSVGILADDMIGR